MERIGYVSLWIGNVSSDEALEEYLEVDYSREGMLGISGFLKDYQISLDDYDEDFVERIFYEEKIEKVGELLAGCSYEETVIPLFNEISDQRNEWEINAAILLYNFEYKGNVNSYEREECKFKYIGSVKYE